SSPNRSFQGAERASEALTGTSTDKADSSECSEHWLLFGPGEPPRELFCSPAASRAELMKARPGADLDSSSRRIQSRRGCVLRFLLPSQHLWQLQGTSKGGVEYAI